MKERFSNRIKNYIFVSIGVLLLLNFFVVMYMIGMIEGYIEYNAIYSAVELKNLYEETEILEDYYISNYAEYNRYYVDSWFSLIEKIYLETEASPYLKPTFYDYLNELQAATNIDVEIYNLKEQAFVYPANHTQQEETQILGLDLEAVHEALKTKDNLLHEVYGGRELSTLKIVKLNENDLLAVTSTEATPYYSTSTSERYLHANLRLLKATNSRADEICYYVLNTANEVLITNDHKLETKVLTIKDEDGHNLLAHSGQFYRTYNRGPLYVNYQLNDHNIYQSIPMKNGQRLVVLINDFAFIESINEITFVSMLITLAGVVILYFIGNVMIYLVGRYDLTARRVARSNQINRMIVLVFVILMLLNGMAIIQVTKIIFFHGYEQAIEQYLERYAVTFEEKEDDFKAFINKIRQDAIMESDFIHQGYQKFSKTLRKPESIFYMPRHTYTYVKNLDTLETGDRDVLKSIETQGYYEFYKGPKLVVKNDFDAFYENYVLERLSGEENHYIDRAMIYSNPKGEGYFILTKDIKPKMALLDYLRDEFKNTCTTEENEIFISKLTLYNDLGTIVIAQDGENKFDSRKLKDELTNYPLWYWYQFKHGEFFRTLVKAIDGTYKEKYSIVHYSDDYEYYYVFSIDRKDIFEPMEKLYNAYVSAIMFLLVGVFLTLGIRIKIKRKRGE